MNFENVFLIKFMRNSPRTRISMGILYYRKFLESLLKKFCARSFTCNIYPLHASAGCRYLYSSNEYISCSLSRSTNMQIIIEKFPSEIPFIRFAIVARFIARASVKRVFIWWKINNITIRYILRVNDTSFLLCTWIHFKLDKYRTTLPAYNLFT